MTCEEHCQPAVSFLTYLLPYFLTHLLTSFLTDSMIVMSASMSRKTVKASRTLMPTLIFSPASAGTQKTSRMRWLSRMRMERRAHGRMMFVR